MRERVTVVISICLSVCLFVCLSVCLSVCQCQISKLEVSYMPIVDLGQSSLVFIFNCELILYIVPVTSGLGVI